tara:strand:- start:142 stop:612 length:471 start_codon:yes stop_codon:yes gene_type:complete
MGCGSGAGDEELQAALERIETLEYKLREAAETIEVLADSPPPTTTTEPPPTTTTEPAVLFSKISAPLARKIANDARIELTGSQNISGFDEQVEIWTEEFILANPGVTDLAQEDFDAWFREQIEIEYASEVLAQAAEIRAQERRRAFAKMAEVIRNW